MDRPLDGITYAEAQQILGRSRSWIGDRIRDGTLPRGPRSKKATLSRAAVEDLALERWVRRRHVPGGYWATAGEVAELLDVTEGWVRQLAERDLLPALRARGRWWLFRRAQITVIAQSRTAPQLANPVDDTTDRPSAQGADTDDEDVPAVGAGTAAVVGATS